MSDETPPGGGGGPQGGPRGGDVTPLPHNWTPATGDGTEVNDYGGPRGKPDPWWWKPGSGPRPYPPQGLPQDKLPPGIVPGIFLPPSSGAHPIPVEIGAKRAVNVPIIFGRQRVLGKMIGAGYSSGAPQADTYFDFLLSEGPIDAVELYEWPWFGATTGLPTQCSKKTLYTGTLGQAADTDLSTIDSWVTFGYPGTAHLVVAYNYGAGVAGVWSPPLMTVRGLQLYDPRENRIDQSEVYSSASGWASSGAFPTLDAGIADPWGSTGAGRWTVGGAGIDLTRNAATNAAATDPVTVSIWLRCAPGVSATLRAFRGADTQDKAIAVTSTWTLFTVTLAAGANTGTTGLKLVGIPASTVLEVCAAQAEWHTSRWGYKKTTGAAIVAVTEWSANPALEMACLKTNTRFGQAVTLTSAGWASVGLSAAYCDEPVDGAGTHRFECHLVIEIPDGFAKWEALIGAHFFGRWQQIGADWIMLCYRPADSAALAIGESDWVASPALRRGTTSGVKDEPTRIVVRWTDPASWQVVSTPVVANIVETALQVREGPPYDLLGCESEKQARRTGLILLTGTRKNLTISARLMPRQKLLSAGVVIAPTCAAVALNGSTMFMLTSVFEQPGGEIQVEGVEYDPAVWGGSGGTADGNPAQVIPNPFSNVPDVTLYATTPPRKVEVTAAWGTGGGIEVDVKTYYSTAFTLPTYPFAKDLVVRYGFGSSVPWNSLPNEVVIPLTGNWPVDSNGRSCLTVDQVDDDTMNWYYADGSYGGGTVSGGGYTVRIRLRSTAGVLSPGVLVAVSAYSSNSAGTGADPVFGMDPVLLDWTAG